MMTYPLNIFCFLVVVVLGAAYSNLASPTTATTLHSDTTIYADNSTFPGSTNVPSPTDSPAATWVINDGLGNPCMMFDFKGYITYRSADTYENEWTIEIPNTANTSESKCSEDKASFWLNFLAPTKDYNYFGLNLVFNLNNGNDLELYRLWEVQTYINTEQELVSNDRTDNFLLIPIGYYYTCQNLTLIPGFYFSVTLIDPKLQPFVNRTAAKNFGDAYKCESAPTTSPQPPNPGGKNIGAIVGWTIAGIVVVAAVGTVVAVIFSERCSFTNKSKLLVNADI